MVWTRGSSQLRSWEMADTGHNITASYTRLGAGAWTWARAMPAEESMDTLKESRPCWGRDHAGGLQRSDREEPADGSAGWRPAAGPPATREDTRGGPTRPLG